MKNINVILWALSGLVNMGSAYYAMKMKAQLEAVVVTGQQREADVIRLAAEIDVLTAHVDQLDKKLFEVLQPTESVDAKATLAIQLAAKTFCQVNPKIKACKGLR